MGQMGQQMWVGHVGHWSVPVTHWPILHCTHPVSHVIFWFMETSNGNRNCY